MINAAIVGLGWWGRTLVESVQSDERRHPVRGGRDAHAVGRACTAFADAQKLTLADSYEALLADPRVRRRRAGDAALAARRAGDRGGAAPASTCSARSRSR